MRAALPLFVVLLSACSSATAGPPPSSGHRVGLPTLVPLASEEEPDGEVSRTPVGTIATDWIRKELERQGLTVEHVTVDVVTHTDIDAVAIVVARHRPPGGDTAEHEGIYRVWMVMGTDRWQVDHVEVLA